MSLLVPSRAVAAVLLVALTGCTNIKNDGARTRAEGTTAGAAGGALLGAGLGALGGGKRGALMGAAGGALAGGAAGRAYGGRVARKKAGYTRSEDVLDAQLSTARRQVAAHRAYNQRLRGVVVRKQMQLAALREKRNPAGATVETFELRTSATAKIAELDQQARSWQEAIAAHKAVVRQSASDPRGGELELEVKRLSAARSELLLQRDRLEAISEKVKP